MEAKKYQEFAMKTLNPNICKDDLLLNAAMGLCGESGEVLDLLKKKMFQGHDLDKDKLILELGDIAWYLAEAATALDTTLDDIFQRNIDKLKKRFPNGFDEAKSINR